MHPILQSIDEVIQSYNNYIGSYAVLAMLVPTGIYFIIRLKFLNVTKLFHSLRVVAGKYDKKGDKGDVNHFKALTTALSATVGTGNIVGVSLAIYFGGPGAIFWMWVTGFLGMILKYAECTLSHKFRRFNSDGTVSGGPMYYMEHGLKSKLGKGARVLAVIFAIATILCSLGTGNMAQANSITDALSSSYNIEVWLSGLVITGLVLLVIVGGIRRIAEVTSFLVPFMAIMYFIAAVTVLAIMHAEIPAAFRLIFHDAFHGEYAREAGLLGGLFLAMTWGIRRGLFSNEAGQGSAPIAHAAARTEYPAREGLVASLEPLIDTLIICTLTALVIIVTGAWQEDIMGVGMTLVGMSTGLEHIGLHAWALHIVTLGLLLFAFSTVISWSYYGSRAANYLLGEKYIKPYSYLYAIFVFLGSVFSIELVWHFVDMVITFMTIPNLIALILLSGVIVRETKSYFDKMKELKNQSRGR
jgi:AGCS family alanine or glycine:cation symporter